MPPAARIGDTTGHLGTVVGPGIATVLIGGQPAAVTGDTHVCPFPPPNVHPPSTLAKGSATVMIGKKPALRIGASAGCGAPIVTGAFTVIVGG